VIAKVATTRPSRNGGQRGRSDRGRASPRPGSAALPPSACLIGAAKLERSPPRSHAGHRLRPQGVTACACPHSRLTASTASTTGAPPWIAWARSSGPDRATLVGGFGDPWRGLGIEPKIDQVVHERGGRHTARQRGGGLWLASSGTAGRQEHRTRRRSRSLCATRGVATRDVHGARSWREHRRRYPTQPGTQCGTLRGDGSRVSACGAKSGAAATRRTEAEGGVFWGRQGTRPVIDARATLALDRETRDGQVSEPSPAITASRRATARVGQSLRA